MMKSFFIKNVVAVAAYSRLASRSQAKFHTMKLSPLRDPCAAAPAQSTTFANLHFHFRLARERTWVQFTHCTSGLPRRLSNTKIEDSCGFLWSSSAALRLKFGQVGSVWNRLFTSLSSIRAWTKWRSDHVTGRLQLNLAQVSWVFAFPKEKRQPSSLSTMPLEWRATDLYSRQSLSRLQGLVAWGVGCSSQGQRSEDTTQGRRCGVGGEESQRTWCHGRLHRNPRSGRYASIPLQAFQQRRVVQDQTNQDKSHKFWVLGTEVRGFYGGMAQLSRVGPL